MQLDMHYYGTFLMARAAGLNREASRIIATASQFVDDNAEKESVNFRDGGRMEVEATAHHTLQLKNLDLEDQRQIWVPFHFLPGNAGASFTERLVCQKNSTIAQEMVEFNLSQCHQSYALPLIGITAHVYADTFSHYGFSGISSRKNRIENDSFNFVAIDPEMKSYILEKAAAFKEKYSKEIALDNIKSWFAENLSGALGHGAAVTFPDRPFLKWNFKYEGDSQLCPLRDNPATFLEACQELHAMFGKVAASRADLADGKSVRDFAAIKGMVAGVLGTQADEAGRIKAWEEVALAGDILGSGREEIPPYDQDSWPNQRENLKRRNNSSESTALDIYQFYQAAAIHRVHVLRKLLPSHGLVVA